MRIIKKLTCAAVVLVGCLVFSASFAGCLTARMSYNFGIVDLAWVQSDLPVGAECSSNSQCRSDCCSKGQCAPPPSCARR